MTSTKLQDALSNELKPHIQNVVFDLGGVLIDWNPRYLYRKIFSDAKEMEYFLTHVCNQEWNEKQDAGRPFRDGIAELVPQYPHYREQIQAYWERWSEMIRGPIEANVEVFWQLKNLKKSAESSSPATYRIFALTNWSAETFPYAYVQFDFLRAFEFVLVSGRYGLKKPDPKIFHKLCEETRIQPNESIFIDDSAANVLAAKNLGFSTIHCI